MQQTPCRLSQALWSAFRAAKPVHRPITRLRQQFSQPAQSWKSTKSPIAQRARFYSDKPSNIEQKIEDAKSRINTSIENKPDSASQADDTKLRDGREATIIKTEPIASSIVEPVGKSEEVPQHRLHPGDEHASANSSTKSWTSSSSERLVSTTANLRARFADFMDNFQSHLFTASRRLNDLTGYSTIEALKNDISAQEALVASTRDEVKAARDQYSNAIATRSTTQREVNDLLHRKHTWKPEDLERFTNLYRSDHANEQVEAAAQRAVADAETRYEEASTKLGRAILARYHEEQVWSDKIRQMSTWGTWGLMGLNVLLFVVFQILVEPWRRRRLVRGFEDKVELALQERDVQLAGLRGAVDSHAAAAAAAVATTQTQPPNRVEDQTDVIAESIAEQIADAVSGAAPSSATGQVSNTTDTATQAEIESAIDASIATDLAHEDSTSPDSSPLSSLYASSASGYAYYANAFREMWSEDRVLVISQRHMTTLVAEAALAGAAAMGVALALLRPR
jgi:sensitive to high expression protein 9, mitochondrial